MDIIDIKIAEQNAKKYHDEHPGGQFETMPTPSLEHKDKIVQYAGATTEDYTNGYFYECVENSGTYSWVYKAVMPEDFIHPTEVVQALGTISSNTTVNCTNGNVVTATVGANLTLSLSGSTSGHATTATLILTNGGNFAVTWDSDIKWAGGSAPTLTQNGVDVLTFICVDGTTWYGTALVDVK